MKDWYDVVDVVAPYVVKIETPDGHGTGFLCFYNRGRTLVGIATARHVVARANYWRQPLWIHHAALSAPVFAPYGERWILEDVATDSAMVLVPVGALPFPEELLELVPPGDRLRTGATVGYLGYPSVQPDTPCFFSGRVSAWSEATRSYLIDGVSIHGVSGGPVLYLEDSRLHVVGSVSAYIVNRATGEALPGLAVARDLTHFHDAISTINSWEDAARAQDAQGREGAPPAPQAPPDTTPQA